MEPNSYAEDSDMQTYAPIGSRVRRGLDWRWGDQDNGGVGTIIGHEIKRDIRTYWCWVEWDEHGETNVYRYEKHGKRDLTIVKEERVPKDGHKISVGCKVKPGDDYKGNTNHVLGIAIKLLSDDKVQIRWDDDGTREELTYGKDGTPKQLVVNKDAVLREKNESGIETSGTTIREESPEEPPFHDTSKLAPPISLEVYDVFERTASLRWEKSTDDKERTDTKYVVMFGETKNVKKKTNVDVDADVCCLLDDLKPGYEYTASVKLVHDQYDSVHSKSVSFKTMKSDIDDTHYAGWPLYERDAARLTSAIGQNWEMLGPALGVGEIPLHRIKSDNQTSTLCIYKMLLRWVNTDKNATFGKLLKALKKTPIVSIDESVINSMKDEFQLMEKSKS